ncbi:MAG: GNAT family N-acetyltransferase [Anaerolineales bacterium]
MLSDLEYLAIEIDTLWTRDPRGRLLREGGLFGDPVPHLVIAAAAEGQLAAASDEVPDSLALELTQLATGAPAPAPGESPSGLGSWATSLAAAMGPVEVTSGRSSVATSIPVANSAAMLVLSDGSRPYRGALQAPEEAKWQPEEWRALLAGELGPWAMAVAGGDVISICFSPRLTPAAAEAGVRTDPAHRGQGHAAATTAAWASLVMASGRHAFYSTSATNLSSQRVAARLGLRPIGWIWQIAPPRA